MMAAANWGKHAGFRKGEGDHLFHDAQNQLGPGGDGEFLKKSVQMRVDSVIRDLETPGNPCFREIVKDALDNLQLAFCQAQGACNLKPGMIAEE